MTGTEGSAPEVTLAHVSVKAPPFYRQSPSMWFRQLESQFAIAHVTKSETKFHHVLSALPEDVAINLELDESADYDKLKEAIINSMKANKHQLIDQALSALELGDKRPSQLVAEIRRRFREVNITPDDTIIKSRLLSALPHNIRSALVGHDTASVEQYAQIADSMLTVANMSATTPFTVAKIEENNSSQFRNREQHHFNNRQQGRKFSSGIRPFYEGQRPRVCNGHIFYGTKSRSCRQWCQWPQKPNRILKDSERTPHNSRPSSPTN